MLTSRAVLGAITISPTVVWFIFSLLAKKPRGESHPPGEVLVCHLMMFGDGDPLLDHPWLLLYKTVCHYCSCTFDLHPGIHLWRASQCRWKKGWVATDWTEEWENPVSCPDVSPPFPGKAASQEGIFFFTRNVLSVPLHQLLSPLGFRPAASPQESCRPEEGGTGTGPSLFP